MALERSLSTNAAIADQSYFIHSLDTLTITLNYEHALNDIKIPTGKIIAWTLSSLR